jgi:hypothetical protein
MKSIRTLAVAVVLILVSLPSFAACTFPITATPQSDGTYRLGWQPTLGASGFEVQVSSDAFQHWASVATLPADATGMTVKELTSKPGAQYTFRVIAANSSANAGAPCTGQMTLNFINSRFMRRVHRTVVPVVGSTRGANGALFKTSLRIGPATSLEIGNIIFHPAGVAGGDDDPSIPYRLERGDTLQFDDIVAAIGQSGIGSLDVVPTIQAGLRVAPVEARLFNEAPQGTYGAFERGVQAADAFRPADWNIFVPSTRFRVNVGIRTLTAAHVTFFHIASTGAVTQKVLDLASDYVFLQAADQFFGEPVLPGDSIVINVTGDNVIAIPFHTLTDNSTNDPAVFNPQSPARSEFADIEVPIVTP